MISLGLRSTQRNSVREKKQSSRIADVARTTLVILTVSPTSAFIVSLTRASHILVICQTTSTILTRSLWIESCGSVSRVTNVLLLNASSRPLAREASLFMSENTRPRCASRHSGYIISHVNTFVSDSSRMSTVNLQGRSWEEGQSWHFELLVSLDQLLGGCFK